MSDILVDGYNVIKNNMMFQAMEIRDFSYARTLLIKQLYSRYSTSSHRIIVVFDGNGSREQVSYENHIRIIFSRHDETADRVIARLASEARQEGREVVMYSDDEEVRDAVTEQGGNACSTVRLTKQLNAAPRDVAIRSAYRQKMRRIYGIDPTHKAEDEEKPPPSIYGKKKRKK